MFGPNDYVEKVMAAQKLGYLLDLDVQDVLAIYRPWRHKSTCYDVGLAGWDRYTRL